MKWINKLLKLLLWGGLIGLLVGLAGVALAYFYLTPQLPDTENLKNVQFQVPLRVYSADEKLIAEFGEKRRIPLRYDQVPERMIQAFLAAEDDRFFIHPGVDYQGILRAAVQLAMTGERRQGGSTITMQVARNFYLSSEKTFTRKINEILLALKIEKDLSKEEILELYLNKIYLGHRAYGVGAAAQVYYGKNVDELDLAQIAMIAGLPKAPSRYNPITDPERALTRRNYVLGRMASLNYITPQQQLEGEAQPVSASIHSAQSEVEAPYIAEMVRAELFEKYDANAYTDGYTVYTTLDSRLQTAANRAVRLALQEYDMRHGYRGAEQQLDLPADAIEETLIRRLKDAPVYGDLLPAIVLEVGDKSVNVLTADSQRITIEWEGLSWAAPYKSENRKGNPPKSAQEILKPGALIRILEQQKKEGSFWRLAQIPQAAGALVSIRPDDGAISALVGGYDFFLSKFNRVTQAKRQPGSGFKAIIYSAALDAGYTPASLINDAPVVFNDPSLESAWRPENYSGKFFGPTRLRYALTKSRNLVSIRLLRDMGIQHALTHAARFGFDPDELPHNLSLALGSAAVTPLQMSSAYAILANGGYRVEPYYITRILDHQNQEIFKANPPVVCEQCPDTPADQTSELPDPANAAETETLETANQPRIAPRAISRQNYYLMNSMMRDVINHGTATRARRLGRNDLAGKTGTTNDQRDAWFNGFNRSLVAIAWVGFDSSKPLGRGEVGGRAALPAWMYFMEEALQGVEEIPLQMPPGIVTVKIDPTTGKRAQAGQSDAIFEVFRSENAPMETASNREIASPGSGNGQRNPVQELF
jgi:penicillin-binding protein 1A